MSAVRTIDADRRGMRRVVSEADWWAEPLSVSAAGTERFAVFDQFAEHLVVRRGNDSDVI
jgi:hypothetical protein